MFAKDSIYAGIARLPVTGYSVQVKMAIKIQTQAESSGYYLGTMSVHKHDGAPGSEYYFTYGGCMETYFYSPSTCKFSYTKSSCLTDKELPPVDKQVGGEGVEGNCCSGSACTGKHSGANIVIRNIEYDAKNDQFVMTLYNNDNKKVVTFTLAKQKGWPSDVFIDRDETVYSTGCDWKSGKCNCS